MRRFLQFDENGLVSADIRTTGSAPKSNAQWEVDLDFDPRGKRFNFDTGGFEDYTPPPAGPVEPDPSEPQPL